MNRKILAFAAALIMAAGLLTGCSDSVRSINDMSKDYDLYIFNTGGESAQALIGAVDAFSDEVGMKVKLWSPEEGDDAESFLKSEMATDGQPGLYWVRDDADVQKWVESGQAMNLNKADGEIAKLAGEVPEAYRLTVKAGAAAEGAGEEDAEPVYGIPSGLEGFGLIVDRELLGALFGEENVNAWLDAYRTATYDEWVGMVKTLSAYVRKDTKGTVTLSGQEFLLPEKKEGAVKGIKAVFAVPGTETWVYSEYLMAPAVAGIFRDTKAVRAATQEQLEAGRTNAEAYAETLYWMCAHSIPARGDDLVNPKKASYGEQINNFTGGKAVFLLQSTRSYARLRSANEEQSDKLVILPVMMPFKDEGITSGLNAEQMNSSLTVYAPGYFVINGQASERERRIAGEFLVWLHSSDTGRKFLSEQMGLIPFNAQSGAETGFSLGSSVYSYLQAGKTLPYLMNACPALWAENDMGTYLIQNYLSQTRWRDDTYEDIANFFISSWMEHE